MNRLQWFGISIFLFVLMQDFTSCGPSVFVNNTSGVGVTVMVGSQGVTLKSGESTYLSMAEGRYGVIAIASGTYLQLVTAKREQLQKQLANPEGMTPQQIQDLTQQLKDITARVNALATKDSTIPNGTCSISVSEQKDNAVTVTLDKNVRFVLSCQ